VHAPEGSPLPRIGELSRRLGVSAHVLRARESRYGLLQPVRSAGGIRLYPEADALRVRRLPLWIRVAKQADKIRSQAAAGA